MASKIAQTEWTRHKETILGLRRSELGLLGKDGIIERMRIEHGFNATRAQYERQLSLWGDRQNLSASEWRRVFLYIDQHGLSFNESDVGRAQCTVSKNGKRVEPSLLKRKRRDHCAGDEYAEARKRQDVRATLPRCIEIRDPGTDDEKSGSPVGEVVATNVAASITDPVTTENMLTSFPAITAPSTYIGTQSSNLYSRSTFPAFDVPTQDGRTLRASSPLFGSVSATKALVSGPSLNFVPGSFPINGNDLMVFGNQRSSVNMHSDGIEEVNPSCLRPEESGLFAVGPSTIQTSTLGRDNRVGETLPSTELDAIFGSCDDFSWGEGSISPILGLRDPQGEWYDRVCSPSPFQRPVLRPQSQFGALSLFETFSSSSISELEAIVHSGQSGENGLALSNTLVDINTLKACLLSVQPPEGTSFSPSSYQKTMARHSAFGSTVIGMVILSAENNFPGLDDNSIGLVLKFLKQDAQTRSQLLKYHKAIPEDDSKALADNLVRAAIDHNEADILRDYLKTGLVSPDGIVIKDSERRYTAVERSVMERCYEVAEALLHAQADLSKTYENHPSIASGPLEYLIQFSYGSEKNPVVVRLVDLFLRFGAEVRSSTITRALERQYCDVAMMLLSRFSLSSNHFEAFEDNYFLLLIVGLLDNKLATPVVVQSIKACRDTGCGRCLESKAEMLEDLLTVAAIRGNLEVVTVLTRYVKAKGPSLAGAIRGGNAETIEYLMNMDINVNNPARPFMRRVNIYILEESIGKVDFATTPLAESLRAKRHDLVSEFERRGALAQMQDHKQFEVAICAASEAGDLGYVEKILQSFHSTERMVTSALKISLKLGHDRVSWKLLRAGVYVSDNSLLEALRHRKKGLFYALLDRYDSMKSISNSQVFEEAVKWGDRSIIGDLSSMVPPESILFFALTKAAVKAGDPGLLTFLVMQLGAPVRIPLRNFWGKSVRRSLRTWYSDEDVLLVAAIQSKNIETLHHLLNFGMDPLCPEAFRLAVWTDRQMFNVLLSAFRAKLPEGKKGFGAEVLEYAIVKRDIRLLDKLLEVKMDVNALASRSKLDQKGNPYPDDSNDRGSALAVAINNCDGQDFSILRKLLAAGGELNGIAARDSRSCIQYTPLMIAINTKSKALVEFLIDTGADIHRPTRLTIRRTPLQYACEVGSIEIVELLIGRGASVNEQPAVTGGGTSLQLCAIKGHVGIAYRLLEQGADVHADPSERDGRTALEGAAEWGRLDMVKLLWEVSGSGGFSQAECERAMKMAEDYGHSACRAALRRLCLSNQEFLMPEL